MRKGTSEKRSAREREGRMRGKRRTEMCNKTVACFVDEVKKERGWRATHRKENESKGTIVRREMKKRKG